MSEHVRLALNIVNSCKCKNSTTDVTFWWYHPSRRSFLQHCLAGRVKVYAELNRQNSGVITVNLAKVPPIFQTKHSTSSTVFGTLPSDSTITDPHFIEAGLCINTKEHLDILDFFLPSIDQHFKRDAVIFLQDFAP